MEGLVKVVMEGEFDGNEDEEDDGEEDEEEEEEGMASKRGTPVEVGGGERGRVLHITSNTYSASSNGNSRFISSSNQR